MSTSHGARTDHDRPRKPRSTKRKTQGTRTGKYERPTTFIKPVDTEVFQHRFDRAFTKARASFDKTIDFVLWDLKTAAPGMALSRTRRLGIISKYQVELHRRLSALEERTAAAISKLLKFGYVSQARKVFQMSNQLRTKFSPVSLAVIARAAANVPSLTSAVESLPNSSSRSSSSSSSSSYPTPESIALSTKWFLWELRPQLYDAVKRKARDSTYQSHLTCAIEEFMWSSFNLRDWAGVLETFDGVTKSMAVDRAGDGRSPSVKMCQLAMQSLFARHYYDAPGKGKEKQGDKETGWCQRRPSGANAVKDGYRWLYPSDHTAMFRKIGVMVEVMRKSGVLYPEVHAILLRELGWLVSSGRTLMSLKLVEDWLVYYEAAMAVRLPPEAPSPSLTTTNSTSASSSTPTTISRPSGSSSTSLQSRPPASIILAAAEAILNILEASKSQLGFKWTRPGQIVAASQKHEYLETTLKPAFDEVMGYLESLSPSLGETIDQHAKTQSVLIRRYLLHDNIRAAWEVWVRLVEDVEGAAMHGEPKKQPKKKLRGRRNHKSPWQSPRPRATIPLTTSLRLESAYTRIFQAAHRLNDVDAICMLLPSSGRILVGRNPNGFVDIWRKSLELLIRQPLGERERLRLLRALRTLDVVLEETVPTAATTPVSKIQPSGGCRERRDVLCGIFNGSLVYEVRTWWRSAADLTAESTKEIGNSFQKLGLELKEPPERKMRKVEGVECHVIGIQGLREQLFTPFFPRLTEYPSAIPPSLSRYDPSLLLSNRSSVPGRPPY